MYKILTPFSQGAHRVRLGASQFAQYNENCYRYHEKLKAKIFSLSRRYFQKMIRFSELRLLFEQRIIT